MPGRLATVSSARSGPLTLSPTSLVDPRCMQRLSDDRKSVGSDGGRVEILAQKTGFG
jgi:hypothetical protein